MVFNNPARHNAMSLDMWAETGRIMEDFASDDSLRCVVLTGAGEKAFVSGADISRFGAERSNEEAVAHYNATTEAASLALFTYPKPTIAMIRGYCIGGGLGIAMCCDLRIATENSTFAVPAAKLGLGYGHPGAEAPDRRRRAVLYQGNLLHGAPVHRRGGARPWASSTAWCRTPSSRTM